MNILPKDVLKLCFEKANMKLHDNYAVSTYCHYCESNYYISNIRCSEMSCNSCFYAYYTFRKGNPKAIELKLLELENLVKV